MRPAPMHWSPSRRAPTWTPSAHCLSGAGAQIVEGPRAGGFYRLRLGGADLSAAEAQKKIDALRQARALVRFAAPSP